MKRRTYRALAILVGILLVIFSGALAFGAGHNKITTAAAPQGFRAFLVYVAEPTLAPGEPSIFTDAANVDHFQHDIMGRTDAEDALQRDLAVAYFDERFGLDFSTATPGNDGSLSIPGATLHAFVQNEHVNYRAYVASDRAVPDTGWLVRDGGFQVTLTQDAVLHGSYGGSVGISAPAGSAMVFGDYNIKVEPPGQVAAGNILIHYQSASPIIARADGEISFNCDLTSDRWGPGAARGIVVNGAIQNVITFPAQLSR
jgi:hypothetical protein